MHDTKRRQELESKVLCMTSHVKDSDSLWQKICQDLGGTERYLEGPSLYGSRIPQNAIFSIHGPNLFSTPRNFSFAPKLSEHF